MMKRHARYLVSGLLLASAIVLLGTANTHSAADDDVKAAVLKLAAKSDPKAAEAIAKKDQLMDVMHGFKLRTKKGFGVGDKAGAITPDGIEAMIINLGKKERTKAELGKQGAALAKMADITRAIAEITIASTPKEKKAGKDPKDWMKWAEEMKEGSTELAKAAKGGDGAGVKKAATKVNAACNECHTVFRD